MWEVIPRTLSTLVLCFQRRDAHRAHRHHTYLQLHLPRSPARRLAPMSMSMCARMFADVLRMNFPLTITQHATAQIVQGTSITHSRSS